MSISILTSGIELITYMPSDGGCLSKISDVVYFRLEPLFHPSVAPRNETSLVGSSGGNISEQVMF